MRIIRIGDQIHAKGVKGNMTVTGKGSRWLLSWIERGHIITERYQKGTVLTMIENKQWSIVSLLDREKYTTVKNKK